MSTEPPGVAAEHDLAEADQHIGDAEGGHEQDDVRLVDQRAQHHPLDQHGKHQHDAGRKQQRQEGGGMAGKAP
jgi:hypothetical protein